MLLSVKTHSAPNKCASGKHSETCKDALKRFSCAQCDAMTAPKIPSGVSVPQTVAPLRCVAMDVKWLPGWEEDVRIKSVNIVDEASNLQHIYPFFETETSESIVSVHEPTKGSAGSQSMRVELIWETLQRALEADGTQVLDVPGEAHEQVGRLEVVILKTCWHEFWLRFGQALGPPGRSAFTRPWKPKILSQEDAVTAPFRLPLAVTPNFQGIFSTTSRTSSVRLQFSTTM